MLSSSVAAIFYNPPAVHKDPIFSISSPTLTIFCLFVVAILIHLIFICVVRYTTEDLS